MADTRFDRISKLFAERRLSRRQALAAGAAGLVATGLDAASAQQASPAAAPPADATPEAAQYLFVQSYASGTIAETDAAGRYTVTLDGGVGQTVYFANRPSRDVGAAPTATFLDGLGFNEDNPPNAALVLEVEPGDADIAVVELFNPTFDDTTNTVTYDVEPLANWSQSLELGFSEAPTDLAELVPEFGAAHVFIDDCADGNVSCCRHYDYFTLRCLDPAPVGTFTGQGYCWSWPNLRCMPCEPYYHDVPNDPDPGRQQHWNHRCNSRFGACEGLCQAMYS